MLWLKNRSTVISSAPVAGTKFPGGPPVNVTVVVFGPAGVGNGAVVMGGNEVMMKDNYLLHIFWELLQHTF